MNPATELEIHIQKVKQDLGTSLVILGHHYQRDEVLQFADFRGDSLKLPARPGRAPA
jgi:quinolinate synthase